MKRSASHADVCVDYGVAVHTLQGELVSGDAYVVLPHERGALLAVIDGAGHGIEATHAAEAAVKVLEAHPEESVLRLMQLCHQELRATRGAAMTIVSLQTDRNTLEWIGVGDVEGYCFHVGGKARGQGVILRGGIVGYQLPALRAAIVEIAVGDILILATDGIRPDFASSLKLEQSPQKLAEQILKRHLRGTDDGLVLVARFVGGAHV